MTHRLSAFTLAALLLLAPMAHAKPGATLTSYQTYLAKVLKLKATETRHVDGGGSSDWLYSFAGKGLNGMALTATVQVGNQRIYSQALTMTARTGNQADATQVASLSLQFWQEVTGGQGKAVEKQIARQISAGAGEASARFQNLNLTLSRLPAGAQTIWVVGAERLK